jgi:hypothetical protein
MVGIFETEAQARGTIGKFLDAGFGSDQIGIAFKDSNLRRHRLPDDLTEMGFPVEEARNFGGESEIGQYILLIRLDGRKQETINILHSNGANEHFSITMTIGSVTVSQQP